MRGRRAPAGPSLDERLDRLSTAVRHADGRVGAAELSAPRDVLQRAGERRQLAPGVTVAALLGATGSGKSSLFNAIIGAPLAAVHVRRPTTTTPLAASWNLPDSARLLDWLEVSERREVIGGAIGGLVLLDLPDIDSTFEANRRTAARLAERVDALVWVLDPQKYADGVIHEEYLHAMREHAAVSLVVLNQVDRLPADDVPAVTAHLRAILEQDGLGDVELLITSAATGAGISVLRDRLGSLAGVAMAAEQRLAADTRTVAADLATLAATAKVAAEVPSGAERGLVSVCADATGADVVTEAVRRSYRLRAARHTGWPPLRWVGRLRPDPLRRLHLDTPSTAATSLPAPTPAQGAAARSAVRDLAWTATEGIADPWRSGVVVDLDDQVPELVTALDSAVAGTDLGARQRPTWWRVWWFLGLLLFLVAVVGAGWLGALAGLRYLALPAPDSPMLGAVPWPTVLLIGGLVVGFVLALLGRLFARAGARRAAGRARRRLEEAVRSTVRETVVAQLDAELTRYRYFDESVRIAASPG